MKEERKKLKKKKTLSKGGKNKKYKALSSK